MQSQEQQWNQGQQGQAQQEEQQLPASPDWNKYDEELQKQEENTNKKENGFFSRLFGAFKK